MRQSVCLCLLLLANTGCKGLLHELQPHRLWRMNYQEPAGRTDGVYFSVDDPLSETVPVTTANPSGLPTSDQRSESTEF